MPQQIVYTDEKEDNIVVKHSKFWKISKAETIKKIIKEYGKASKITVILFFLTLIIFGSAFSEKVEAQTDKLIIPSGSDPVNLVNSDFLVDQNITTSDSLLSDYLFPNLVSFTSAGNLAIAKNIHILEEISSNKFHFYKKGVIENE